MIRNQITIEKNQASVFERIVEEDHRTQWMDEIISIQMNGPIRQGATFTQKQKEGKTTNQYQGVIEKVEGPKHFSYKLSHKAFDMRIGYELQGQGASTHVIQYYEVRYKSFLAKVIGKLFSSFTKKLAKKQLENLKQYCER